MRLAIYTRESFIKLRAKARCYVCDTWPVVVNHQVQRHLAVVRDLRCGEPAKPVRNCQHPFTTDAVERLRNFRRDASSGVGEPCNCIRMKTRVEPALFTDRMRSVVNVR